ncbi:porin family protein [Proteobacteria bacterium 005FR1]|nr:porin family protein [Proteobacteria bacterium 005FR1]
MFRKSLLLAATCSLALSSQANAEFNWYADAQLAFGGDELADVEIEYDDGDVDDQSIDAGEGFSFSVGTRFDIAGNLDGVLALGYKNAGIVAGDDNVDFTRKMLTGIAFYDFGRLQLGLGLSQEMSPKLDLKDAGGGRYTFDDALGTVVQLDFEISEQFVLGLRHTAIEYEPESVDGFAVDGNNFALVAGFTF